MKILITRNSSLPPLAWCCQIKKLSGQAHVEVGDGVETDDDHFFEGAWAGDFGKADFLDTPCFGTGARVVGKNLVFTGPDHILDRLFLLREGQMLSVSNSISFLLARTGKALSVDRADYPRIYAEIHQLGLTNYRTPLPLSDGSSVEIWTWFQMRVSDDLTITCQDKEWLVPLPDFAAYVGFLSQTIDAVFKNAAHSKRRLRFKPISTISSGYDSVTISALSRDFGCDEVLTFVKSRSKLGRPEEDDSGSEAAKILDFSVIELDRLGFRTQPGLPEIETLGAGSELSSARHELKNRVLLTGFLGDTMWDREPAIVSSDLRLPVISGINLTEFRLSTAFVHFCVPFLAALQQTDIIRISQSDEMAPWRLNNDYDRPICRRICEEKGVPREAFGMKKRAAGVFFREEGVQQTMTPQSYADYSAYRLKHSNVSRARARLTDRLMRLGQFSNSVMGRVTKLVGKALGKTLTSPKIPLTPGISSEGALLFQWAVTRCGERYSR